MSQQASKAPWYQSQGVSALLGILALLAAVFGLGDRLWVTRDLFEDRSDRIESKIDDMRMQIQLMHSKDPSLRTGHR